MAETTTNKRKRPAAAIVGALIVLFTCIGIFSTVFAGVRLVKKLTDDSRRYAEFERLIYPVVMFDPVPFANIDAADPSMLLQSSMWAVLLNQDTSAYQTDDIGFLLIPSTDLDVWCKRMFGNTVTLEHATIEGDSTTFYYSEDNKMYHVPAQTGVVHYTPRVKGISKNGTTCTLTVDYISPMSIASNIFTENDEPIADKTMYYVLSQTDSGYIITSVRYTADEPVYEESSQDTSSEEISSEAPSSEETSSEETSSEEVSSEEASQESSDASGTEESGETSSGSSSSGETSSSETSDTPPVAPGEAI